ncbi:MAG: RDD family protein [Balneola sp.]|nr:MAG: RDD family protein [Balneola sp.]
MENISYPYLIDRIKAFFIDWILLATYYVAVALILENFEDPLPMVRLSLFVVPLFLYEPLTVSFFGGTIGHYLIGLRVRQYRDPDQNIFVALSFFRHWTKFLLGWLSLLTVSFSDNKRAIHDMLSVSVVIKLKK